MRLILPALALLTLAGCGAETRTSWETSRQFRHITPIELPANLSPAGVTRVVYPDNKPSMDIHSHAISYEHGVHINDYDASGALVSHRWQASVPLAE